MYEVEDQMRAPVVFLIALLSLCDHGVAEETGENQVQITFQMVSSLLPDDARVFIAGNVAGLGKWRPDTVEMSRAEDAEHVWRFELTVPVGTAIEYKYTLGSWAKEGAGADGRPLNNFALKATQQTIQEDRIDRWTDRPPKQIRGQITGQVRYHRQVSAGDIRPRDVVVWLPPSYDDASDRRYPVLYMHDGQNLFDPRTSAFGVDWQLDETLTRLIEQEKMPPLIVVGIYNSPDRSQEYSDSPKGTDYRRFVIDEVKPMIDRRYRTKPQRDATYVGGSSAGGLCAFIMAWENTDTFSRAICMSPAFRYERPDGTVSIDYVRNVRATNRPEKPLRIYIDNGGRGVDTQLQPGVDAMTATLREKGLQNNRDFVVIIAPEDPHNEAAWAKRLPGALTWLLQ